MKRTTLPLLGLAGACPPALLVWGATLVPANPTPHTSAALFELAALEGSQLESIAAVAPTAP
ncbi:MAG: hypothetical protein ACLFR7_04215 [Opitutales bacterium]